MKFVKGEPGIITTTIMDILDHFRNYHGVELDEEEVRKYLQTMKEKGFHFTEEKE